MKKTLMIAATALALTTGAAALNTSPAEAGVSVHVGFYNAHYYGGCYYKRKKVRRKVWHYHGYYKHWHWKWVWRNVKICY